MCYKYMWDNLVADNFPSNQFFDFFTLNPHYILSEEIQQNTAKSGIPAKVKFLLFVNYPFLSAQAYHIMYLIVCLFFS